MDPNTPAAEPAAAAPSSGLGLPDPMEIVARVEQRVAAVEALLQRRHHDWQMSFVDMAKRVVALEQQAAARVAPIVEALAPALAALPPPVAAVARAVEAVTGVTCPTHADAVQSVNGCTAPGCTFYGGPGTPAP